MIFFLPELVIFLNRQRGHVMSRISWKAIKTIILRMKKLCSSELKLRHSVKNQPKKISFYDIITNGKMVWFFTSQKVKCHTFFRWFSNIVIRHDDVKLYSRRRKLEEGRKNCSRISPCFSCSVRIDSTKLTKWPSMWAPLWIPAQ